MREGFFKVAQEGGTYIVATFFNPDTKEVFTKCVRDYDYSDCSRDDDELYYMPINEKVRHMYLNYNGVICIGDMVKVVKGRKVPIGTVGVVVDLKPWRDKYGRVQTVYAYLHNGYKASVANCVLVEG